MREIRGRHSELVLRVKRTRMAGVVSALLLVVLTGRGDAFEFSFSVPLSCRNLDRIVRWNEASIDVYLRGNLRNPSVDDLRWDVEERGSLTIGVPEAALSDVARELVIRVSPSARLPCEGEFRKPITRVSVFELSSVALELEAKHRKVIQLKLVSKQTYLPVVAQWVALLECRLHSCIEIDTQRSNSEGVISFSYWHDHEYEIRAKLGGVVRNLSGAIFLRPDESAASPREWFVDTQ